MSTTGQAELLPRRCTDERGRLLRPTPEQDEARKAAALKALDDIMDIGDEAEHRETLEYLMKALRRDPLVSDRHMS